MSKLLPSSSPSPLASWPHRIQRLQDSGWPGTVVCDQRDSNRLPNDVTILDEIVISTASLEDNESMCQGTVTEGLTVVLVLTHSTHVYTYTHTLTQPRVDMHTDKQRTTQNLHMHSCTHTHTHTHILSCVPGSASQTTVVFWV